ncbi:uncharacterized protein LOC117643555 [Thrips palmi]|uniref:Uncharacterized protein LOC117643555 n=1 Tax=Thrips palmi TaxID=161013 RepID=A0A6P8YNG7_THRPL|nr:uncharacterized protein LOC117643555 [Thrips palmi]
MENRGKSSSTHGSMRKPVHRFVLLGVAVVLGLHLAVNLRMAPSRRVHRETLQRGSKATQATATAAATAPRESQDGGAMHVRDVPLLLDTPGCRIPDLVANSSEVAPYVVDYDMGGDCGDPPPLVRSTDDTLYVDKEALDAYGVPAGARPQDHVRCCYSAMWRPQLDVVVPDWGPGSPMPPVDKRKGLMWDKVAYGNDIRYGDECVPFFEPVVVLHEFVRVNCTVTVAASVTQLRDYHAFVPVRRPRGWAADADDAGTKDSEAALNVLVVGVDSVSRLNALRTMPRTLAALARLGGTTMLGYNKVEDNTFPNLVPLLSGLSVPELRRRCWADDHGGNDAHFDACSWIWKRFNARGYVNMFAEDTAWMGLFHYLKQGFVVQPTDYDPRPLLYVGERDLGRKLRRRGSRVCLGQRTQLEVLFEYGTKFVRAMAQQRRKFFAVVWGTSLSHDDLNAPAVADDMYERLLGDLEATGVLNKTALVFMSDHGLRFGGILETAQGRLEERLPLMHVVLPEWLRARYPAAADNLQRNGGRLVTVYDLHETMFDLMDLSSLEARASREGSLDRRGISLFSRIPGERTCAQAGIPGHYCACQLLDPVPVSDHRVLQVAEYVISEVNSMLSSSQGAQGSPCAKLHLDSVLDARKRALGGKHTMPILEEQYQLVVRTQPGAALLSATVTYRLGTSTMQLDGTINRINKYGKQGQCIEDFKLRILCYCNNSQQ